jgi:hypothetical protein
VSVKTFFNGHEDQTVPEAVHPGVFVSDGKLEPLVEKRDDP